MMPPRGDSPPNPQAPDNRFRCTQRLRAETDVERTFKNGLRRHHRPLSACILRRSDNRANRIAISIGKRCGNAVMRNAIRRRIREAYRLKQHQFACGFDILLMVKPHERMKMIDYQAIILELLGGL